MLTHIYISVFLFVYLLNYLVYETVTSHLCKRSFRVFRFMSEGLRSAGGRRGFAAAWFFSVLLQRSVLLRVPIRITTRVTKRPL